MVGEGNKRSGVTWLVVSIFTAMTLLVERHKSLRNK